MKVLKSFPYAPVAVIFLLAMLVPLIANWNPSPVYDDKTILETHKYVMSGDHAAIWTTPYWGGVAKIQQQENLYRPFFLSTMALARDRYGLLRLLILMLHCGVGFVGYHLLKTAQDADKAVRREDVWDQLLIAVPLIFFLLSPGQVEVTAQAIGLMEIMPLLLGLIGMSWALQAPWLALALVALAPGWKETGFIWLLGLGVYFARYKKFRPCAGAAVCMGAWLVARRMIYGSWLQSFTRPYALLNPTVEMNSFDSFLSHLALIGHNLRIGFLPFDLSSDYSRGTLPLPGYLLQIWVLLGLSAIYGLWRFRKQIPLSIWLALLTILPSLDFTGTLVILFAERFGYAFRFGLLYLTFIVLRKIKMTAKSKVLVSAGLMVSLCCLTEKMFERHRDWRSPLTLFSKDAQLYPANAKLQFNLGVAYGEHQDWEQAERFLVEAVNLAPDFAEAHYRLGMVYRAKGSLDKSNMHFQAAKQLGWNF